MIIRYISAATVGLGVTAALFYLMSSLIASGENPLSEDTVGKIVDFVRIKQEETVKTKDRQVEKPDKPQAPPPSQPNPQVDRLNVDTPVNAGYSFNPDVNVEGSKMGEGEGDYLPIVKVQPNYPRRALSRGVEGYVIVEFMVTKNGTTRDVRVVEADPEGYFERAAVKAAEKFKYKPRVIDGEAVPVAGVRNIIRFDLADE
jgi:protein TonB